MDKMPFEPSVYDPLGQVPPRQREIWDSMEVLTHIADRLGLPAPEPTGSYMSTKKAFWDAIIDRIEKLEEKA